MWEDPIVAEIHKIRQEIMAKFDNDLDAYVRYIQGVEEEKRKRGVRYIDTPIRKTELPEPDAA